MGWVVLAGVCTGVVCLLYALYLHQQGTQAASWPATEATITHISIKHTGVTGGGTEETRRKWFLPVIRYRYRVGARDYESERILAGEIHPMLHEGALEIVRPYKEGMKVQARYDPRSPGYAVLEARADSGALTVYVVVGILALAGAVWLKLG